MINGAYQPEPSPDGKSLAYVGYTHDGYDVFVMPLDPSQWLDPLPYEETRPAPPAEPPPVAVARRSRTTRSSRCSRATTRCRSRRATSARRASSRASGSDIAGHPLDHAEQTTEWEHPALEGSISYTLRPPARST